jgi:hypothetical protein
MTFWIYGAVDWNWDWTGSAMNPPITPENAEPFRATEGATDSSS